MRGREVGFQTKGGAEKVYSPEVERFLAMIRHPSQTAVIGYIPVQGCLIIKKQKGFSLDCVLQIGCLEHFLRFLCFHVCSHFQYNTAQMFPS